MSRPCYGHIAQLYGTVRYICRSITKIIAANTPLIIQLRVARRKRQKSAAAAAAAAVPFHNDDALCR